jgi:hypothetical protein
MYCTPKQLLWTIFYKDIKKVHESKISKVSKIPKVSNIYKDGYKDGYNTSQKLNNGYNKYNISKDECKDGYNVSKKLNDGYNVSKNLNKECKVSNVSNDGYKVSKKLNDEYNNTSQKLNNVCDVSKKSNMIQFEKTYKHLNTALLYGLKYMGNIQNVTSKSSKDIDKIQKYIKQQIKDIEDINRNIELGGNQSIIKIERNQLISNLYNIILDLDIFIIDQLDLKDIDKIKKFVKISNINKSITINGP